MLNDKFFDKVKELDHMDKVIFNNYFLKRESIDNLFDILRSKDMLKRESFGNVNAKIMFVIDFDKTNDKCIDIIKKYYKVNNIDFYSSYFTSLDKTNNMKINKNLLIKELGILKPNRLILITDENLDFIANDLKYITMKRSDLDFFLNFSSIKDTATETQNIKRKECLDKLNKVMEFAILGKMND